ncbi:uncharacterized protein FOMMEDRAFT_147693 [Fomitiporia mediterranea MF3/22]|uniref:uncharacterized protein n=1 Tax=Fomitiporia mediterranea (strain MF3/22) TaxID=694068 RepID=UPI0004409794|nr:uncharacterized protein FOMMEDRAFT_147693 [Fomitiporia mediterranea MF3/22]EJD01033.1 hypothetical protein FOMMEDRAFT_147693 [Fomitiporia mediterranea MF3/22]
MSNEVEVATKSKKKEKKVKQVEKEESTERSKKKKKEQTDLTIDADGGSNTAEKRKKRRGHHEDDPENNEMDKKSTKKRKRRKTDDTSLTGAYTSGVIEPEGKANLDHEDDATREKDTGNKSESSKKKSSKESKKSKKERRRESASSLPNPEEDSTLTDKARAALSYAYARVSSSDSWKFNKAHQNWIVKHFFIPDAVPEKYVPIVVGYLAGCQGGVREHLIETCKKHLEPTTLSSDTATPAIPVDTEQQDEASAGRTVKFQLPSEADDSVPSQESEEALKTRARVLLNALGHTPS